MNRPPLEVADIVRCAGLLKRLAWAPTSREIIIGVLRKRRVGSGGQVRREESRNGVRGVTAVPSGITTYYPRWNSILPANRDGLNQNRRGGRVLGRHFHE